MRSAQIYPIPSGSPVPRRAILTIRTMRLPQEAPDLKPWPSGVERNRLRQGNEGWKRFPRGVKLRTAFLAVSIVYTPERTRSDRLAIA